MYADLNDALARISLRPLQYTLLVMVAENPGASQSGVCEALGIQKANCVPTMSELERRGLIIRRKSASDARSYELHITNKGKRILQRAGEAPVLARTAPHRTHRHSTGATNCCDLLGKLTDLK